jgi:hypothetical protein
VDVNSHPRNSGGKNKIKNKALALAELIWTAVRFANDIAIKWKDDGEMINQIGVMQLVGLSVIFFIAIWGILSFLFDNSICLIIVRIILL